jgi:hypothetical protein
MQAAKDKVLEYEFALGTEYDERIYQRTKTPAPPNTTSFELIANLCIVIARSRI